MEVDKTESASVLPVYRTDTSEQLARLSEGDLYIRLKKLQEQLAILAIQEEYVKDEHQNLKRELIRAQEEVIYSK